MRINGKEYITAEQVALLKNLYLEGGKDKETIYPTKEQVEELKRKQPYMSIDKFLEDESGFWWIIPNIDPQRAKKGEYERLMNPTPEFINEYGEPLYCNPFAYEHMLNKGNRRVY